MSDDVKCDCCKKRGRRPRMHSAPKDWMFLEAKDDEAPNPDATTVIVYACSAECALKIWQKGPGHAGPLKKCCRPSFKNLSRSS
jgi:hypothetical protein